MSERLDQTITQGEAHVLSLVDSLATRVVQWQRQHGRRDLPWQQTRDPYRVWLSEIMLQQTQVVTVLAYYERFLQHFPTVFELAAASQEEVMALWSGLGYYSRARNLHRCAQAVVEVHGGQFPQHSAQLQTLPGIGPSTAAAIAAFCFNERAAILDGNVKRVLGRVLAYEGDLAQTAHEKQLWRHAQALLPEAPDMPAYTQGLMDLGASLCALRQPRCEACPLQSLCLARAQGRQASLPVKTRKLKRSRRSLAWLVLRHGPDVALVLRPQTGIWAGLWSPPEAEDAPTWLDLAREQGWPGEATVWPVTKHVLTHLDVLITPVVWVWPTDAVAQSGPGAPTLAKAMQALAPAAGQGGAGHDQPLRWVGLDEALAMGLPTPLRQGLPAWLSWPTP